MARLLHLVSVALMALLLLNASNMSEQASTFLQNLSRVARSTNHTTPKVEEKCKNNGICGWAFFFPFTRQIDYYMPEGCKCQEPTQCVLTNDADVAINAFRFRCQIATTAPTTTEPPPTLPTTEPYREPHPPVE